MPLLRVIDLWFGDLFEDEGELWEEGEEYGSKRQSSAVEN
jgi:hypothetical protein